MYHNTLSVINNCTTTGTRPWTSYSFKYMFISIYLKLINQTSKWHRSDNFNYFTCTLATLGGSTSPLLSPWIIHITPMVRVVSPQEFWYTYCFSSVSWSCIQISNILEKFCPKWWDVAPWKKKRIINCTCIQLK